VDNPLSTAKVFLDLISSVWYLIPILVFATISRTPWFKGVLGEFIVNLSIHIFLSKNHYHLLKNITLPTPEGTTQIDHIIISIYGIFVIETKNMHGWIFGTEHQAMWTQKIYKYTHKFQNPLHQNYKHIKTLQQLLELNDNQLHSLIVFVGDNQFKTKMPKQITYGKESINYIKSKTTPVLTKKQVQQIITKIENNKFKNSYKTHKQHIQHVEKIIQQKQSKPQQKKQNNCPRCNNQLILRTSKFGKQFWGCSTFPKCRYTKNL